MAEARGSHEMSGILQLVPELRSAAQGRKRNGGTSLLAEPEPVPGSDRTLGLSVQALC